jgi:hypothetical protein
VHSLRSAHESGARSLCRPIDFSLQYAIKALMWATKCHGSMGSYHGYDVSRRCRRYGVNMKHTTDVFGIRTTISEHSYIDRGNLDEAVESLSRRDQHIALRGDSKSGKSWLRQKVFPNSNIIQCRINDDVTGIYRQILSNLGISTIVEETNAVGGRITFEGSVEAGWRILAKASGKASADGEIKFEKVTRPLGRDEFDVEFICELMLASDRRVIIEDFHYLSNDVQRHLAHELKTLWDYGVYIVVVGVWHRKNYLIFLNPDLAGRISELGVEWTDAELAASFTKGCKALNVSVSKEIANSVAQNSYGNIGILQSLSLHFLEACDVRTEQRVTLEYLDVGKLLDAGMNYADQLEAVYALFAERIAEGIRKRKDATQIYSFALWAVMESTDEEALNGLSTDWIFEKSRIRQPRIQKPNLRSVLRKFKELQVDDRGKGVVISFDEASDKIILVDRGLLFYRRYTTQSWPWERMAMEAKEAGTGIEDM